MRGHAHSRAPSMAKFGQKQTVAVAAKFGQNAYPLNVQRPLSWSFITKIGTKHGNAH
jgi:hypothetical protein